MASILSLVIGIVKCNVAKIIAWQRKPDRVKKMTLNISDASRAKIRMEGRKMNLSATMFASLLLETIAEDDLFSAVLD